MMVKELYRIFLECKGVSIDTRSIHKDNLFIALKGSNFDGNLFVEEAIDRGARYVVTDMPENKGKKAVIMVENSMLALQQLANFHRKKMNIPVIAITGTNGKTTTKELLAAILAMKFNVLFTKGNLNNHIGVPLTLLNLRPDHEIAIIEMGANHHGEIQALCEIAEPGFGLITNIGNAHLEGFGSFDGVVETKTELYRFLEKAGGNIFVNLDNEILKRHAFSKKLNYGTSNKSEVQGIAEDETPYLVCRWKCGNQEWGSRNNTVNTHLIGKYNLENVLAAIRIGLYFTVDKEDVKSAIEAYIPSNNRSQFVEKGTNMIVMDAYNANPTSMKLAIENFAGMKERKRKVLILGDMLELGKASSEEHEKILKMLEKNNFTQICLVGQAFYEFREQYKWDFFRTTADFSDWLRSSNISDALILVKGSRGIKLECVTEIIE